LNPAFGVDKLRVSAYFIFEKLKRKRGIIRTRGGCQGEEIVYGGDPELTEHSYSSFPRKPHGISLGSPYKKAFLPGEYKNSIWEMNIFGTILKVE
jgi:hypothetical protein